MNLPIKYLSDTSSSQNTPGFIKQRYKQRAEQQQGLHTTIGNPYGASPSQANPESSCCTFLLNATTTEHRPAGGGMLTGALISPALLCPGEMATLTSCSHPPADPSQCLDLAWNSSVNIWKRGEIMRSSCELPARRSCRLRQCHPWTECTWLRFARNLCQPSLC